MKSSVIKSVSIQTNCKNVTTIIFIPLFAVKVKVKKGETWYCLIRLRFLSVSFGKKEQQLWFGLHRVLHRYNFSLCVLQDFVLMFYGRCICWFYYSYFVFQTPDNKNAFVHFDTSLTAVIGEKKS